MTGNLSDIGPILITGTFRSGTTLISRIMQNHQEINSLYDSVNYLRFSYNKYNPINKKKNYEDLINEIGSRIKERWDLNLSITDVINTVSNSDITYASIYNCIMNDLLLKNTNYSIWGEKTTLIWSKIPDFYDMFPNGRVILIIRDPRAVLLSWKNMTNAPGNDYLDAILNCRDAMETSKKYDIEFSNKRYITLRYEDLVINPENTIKHVCDKLELTYSKEMLNTGNFKNKNGEKWEGNSMFKNKIQGISPEFMNKWEKDLKNWEIFITESITKKYFKRFNYEVKIENPSQEIINKAILMVQESELVTQGIINFALLNKGIERFPTDPLIKKNWDKK